MNSAQKVQTCKGENMGYNTRPKVSFLRSHIHYFQLQIALQLVLCSHNFPTQFQQVISAVSGQEECGKLEKQLMGVSRVKNDN